MFELVRTIELKLIKIYKMISPHAYKINFLYFYHIPYEYILAKTEEIIKIDIFRV